MALTFGPATITVLNAELTAAGVYTEDEIKALVTDILYEFRSTLWDMIPGCTVDRFTGEVSTSWDNEEMVLRACTRALELATEQIDAEWEADRELERIAYQLGE